MFAVSTYEEIEENERNVENQEIVVLLFVKPNSQDEIDIINEFEYIHYNSGKYCSVYAVGYTNNSNVQKDAAYKRVEHFLGTDWFFSARDFVDFKNKLEKRIKWKYSGETEILILQNNPGRSNSLNFQNYVAVDVNKGIREGYMDSFQVFMEALVRSSKSKVTTNQLVKDFRRSRLSIKEIVCETIQQSKKVPIPVKKIVKDRMFYRTTKSFGKIK